MLLGHTLIRLRVCLVGSQASTHLSVASSGPGTWQETVDWKENL